MGWLTKLKYVKNGIEYLRWRRGVAGAAKVSEEVVEQAVVKQATEGGTHLVYQGFDKAGIVKYVGITGRDAAVRFGEHLGSGTAKSSLRYEVIPGAINLSKAGARTLEQKVINQFGLGKNGGQLLNEMNSIAPKNWSLFGIH
jgi:hypothetical protein